MTPLDPYEQRVLRGIEEHLTADDPRLSRRVDGLRPSLLDRGSPTRWPRRVWMVLGAVLLSVGILLPEGSSLLGGAAALAIGWGRPHLGRPEPTDRPADLPNRPEGRS